MSIWDIPSETAVIDYALQCDAPFLALSRAHEWAHAAYMAAPESSPPELLWDTMRHNLWGAIIVITSQYAGMLRDE